MKPRGWTQMDRLDGAGRDAVLALNNAHAVETSVLDAGTLRRMIATAHVAVAVGADAFLIAFDESANYDSANFTWFRDRHARFVYVDRIVVSPAARGRGLARRLYAHLFDTARASGRDLIACEVNVTPPNLASDAFHAAMGFQEVGRADRGPKTVRYLVKRLNVG